MKCYHGTPDEKVEDACDGGGDYCAKVTKTGEYVGLVCGSDTDGYGRYFIFFLFCGFYTAQVTWEGISTLTLFCGSVKELSHL